MENVLENSSLPNSLRRLLVIQVITVIALLLVLIWLTLPMLGIFPGGGPQPQMVPGGAQYQAAPGGSNTNSGGSNTNSAYP